jgi:hypothetical protein
LSFAVRSIPFWPRAGGHDHLHDVRKPVLREEHVLGAAQADAARAERERDLGVARDVRVGADAQAPDVVRPAQQLLELAIQG